MYKPFDKFINKESVDLCNLCEITGKKYKDGKDIYRATYDIQQLSTFLGAMDAETYIMVEGMVFNGTTYNPLKIVSISNAGIVLDNQTISPTDTGYFNVIFTKVTSTNNMIPFVVTASILLLLIVISLINLSVDIDTKPMISTFNDILYK